MERIPGNSLTERTKLIPMAVDLLIAAGGFIFGHLVLGRIGAWAAAIRSIILEPATGSSARIAKAATATVLSSAPWLIGVAIFLSYSYRSSDWAAAFITGVAGALVFSSAVAVHLRMLRNGGSTEAPQQLPSFVRFALWAGPRKRVFMVAHGIVLGGIMLAYWAILLPSPISLGLWLLFAFGGFLSGALMGWFHYQLYIWPTYAAFPRKVLLFGWTTGEWPHTGDEKKGAGGP